MIFVGLVSVFNLLVMNDVMSVLEIAEADNIFYAQEVVKGEASLPSLMFQLPASLLIHNYWDVGFDLFLLRLTNVLLLLFTMLLFFWWGKKLFGKATMFLTLLVVFSSFLVISASKFVVNDIWLMAFQLISFIALLLLLKQSSWKWRILFWVSTILAIQVYPLSALVFSFGMGLFLFFFHPNGKRLFNLLDVLLAIISCALVYIFHGFEIHGAGFIFNYVQTNRGEYFLINLIGVLPWLAFLPSAIVDLVQKMRKREEMAIISFAFLLFSILSYGLILQIAFAFLIAKQIENYFKPNYPYTNLVKSFTVLNIFFSFFLVAVFLLTGYETFPEIGFRSRMGACGVYWAFGFLAVIGLFGKSKAMIVGGMSLGGSLTMLLFWTQVMPLLENYRNLPEKLSIEIEKISEKETTVYIHESFFDGSKLPVRDGIYFNSRNINWAPLNEKEGIENKSNVLVLNELAYSERDSTKVEEIQIVGRNRIFDTEQTIWVIKE